MLLFMVGPLSFSQIYSVTSPFLRSPSGENLGGQLSLKYLVVRIHTNFIDRAFAKASLGELATPVILPQPSHPSSFQGNRIKWNEMTDPFGLFKEKPYSFKGKSILFNLTFFQPVSAVQVFRCNQSPAAELASVIFDMTISYRVTLDNS